MAPILLLAIPCRGVTAQVVIEGTPTSQLEPQTFLDILKKGDPKARGQLPSRDDSIYGVPACTNAAVLPDSLALVATPDRPVVFNRWSEPIGDRSLWSPSYARLDSPDTLRIRVLDVRCGTRVWGLWDVQIIAEHDGYMIGIPADNFFDREQHRVYISGEIAVRVIGPGGALDTAVFRQTCPGRVGTCFSVGPLRPVRDSLALAEHVADSVAQAERSAAAAQAARDRAATRAREDRQAAAAREARARLIRGKGWSPEITATVLARKISIGMTREMVQLSWGSPVDINTTVTANSHREQWVYGLGTYVYFESGRVVAVQR